MIPAGLPHDLTFAHRDALYLLAIPAVVLLWGLINAREVRRVFAPLMRAIVLALFVVALANPQQVMHSEGAARPAIVDASASITPAMRAWTLKLLRDDLGLRAGDPAYDVRDQRGSAIDRRRRVGIRQRERMRRMRTGRDQS